MKLYLSWKLSKDIFPDQILLVPYANLIKNSEETFNEIFDFIGVKNKSNSFKKCLKEALELSKAENIKSLEKRKGKDITSDRKAPESSHIRDGKVGSWQNYFSEDDFQDMIKIFKSWNVSPDEFLF